MFTYKIPGRDFNKILTVKVCLVENWKTDGWHNGGWINEGSSDLSIWGGKSLYMVIKPQQRWDSTI